MIKILLSIYLLLSSFVLFAQGYLKMILFGEMNLTEIMFLVLCIGVI